MFPKDSESILFKIDLQICKFKIEFLTTISLFNYISFQLNKIYIDHILPISFKYNSLFSKFLSRYLFSL